MAGPMTFYVNVLKSTGTITWFQRL